VANHLTIKIEASKLTTHNPRDADSLYLNYLEDELTSKMRDHGFYNAKVEIKVEPDGGA
jgi:hypothetical protein